MVRSRLLSARSLPRAIKGQWGSAQYSDLPQYELIAKSGPHTFGAALAKREALLCTPRQERQNRHYSNSRRTGAGR